MLRLKSSAILLMSCKLKNNISSSLTQYIYDNNGVILYHQHYVEPDEGMFFSRIEWSLDNFRTARHRILDELSVLFLELDASLQLYFSDEPVRTSLFVSLLPGCLFDLISRLSIKL